MKVASDGMDSSLAGKTHYTCENVYTGFLRLLRLKCHCNELPPSLTHS